MRPKYAETSSSSSDVLNEKRGALNDENEASSLFMFVGLHFKMVRLPPTGKIPRLTGSPSTSLLLHRLALIERLFIIFCSFPSAEQMYGHIYIYLSIYTKRMNVVVFFNQEKSPAGRSTVKNFALDNRKEGLTV